VFAAKVSRRERLYQMRYSAAQSRAVHVSCHDYELATNLRDIQANARIPAD